MQYSRQLDILVGMWYAVAYDIAPALWYAVSILTYGGIVPPPCP